MGFLVKINNDKTEIIKSKSFRKEEDLQEIVKKFPEIIPLEEINEDFDPLLVIGREFSLEGAGDIDLLAIDKSGLITIIEFKLEKNTDIRKVVAQVIEYAANMWEMSYADLDRKVRDYFKSSRCEITKLKNSTLVQAVKWHFERTKKESEETEITSEEFIINVSNNLQKGEFRLMVFCDNVDVRTKRAVEYLNDLASFDIYCIATDAYDVDGKIYFKSSLITIDRKKTSSEKKRAGKITFDDFVKSVPDEFKEVYKYFDEKRKETNGYYSMGTKGFAAYLQIGDNKMRIFEAYPAYISLLSKNFVDKYINKDEIIVPQEAIKDYQEKISKISSFKDSFDYTGVYPNYKYSNIKPEELKEYFNFMTDWYKRWFM